MSLIIGYETSAAEVQVARHDRWSICQRLQDLKISCSCPKDGSLKVEVNSPIDALLVYSVVKQLTAPRNELVAWLERCQDMSCRV